MSRLESLKAYIEELKELSQVNPYTMTEDERRAEQNMLELIQDKMSELEALPIVEAEGGNMSAPEKIYMSEHTASREGFKKKYAKDDLEYIRSDLYEKALADCKRLLNIVQHAYRKHHLDDNNIGWDELSEMMLDELCNTMGDQAFNEWLRIQKGVKP
jgi:hypothetical protein